MDVLLGCLAAALLTSLWFARRERRHTAALLEATQSRHAAELERLSGLALHDPLTGLPNRVLLHDRLRHALSSSSRRGGQVGVLFLDLDGFKAVNDGYGHAVGDEVLATVAQRLRASVRAGDTPARLSGDEFVVVCEGVDDELALAGAALRLERAVAAPMVLGDRTITLGCSVGAVLHHATVGETVSHAATRLVSAADQRMYDVKKERHLQLAELGVLNQLAVRSLQRG